MEEMEFHSTVTLKGDFWAVLYDDDNNDIMLEYIIGFEIWTVKSRIDNKIVPEQYCPLTLDFGEGVTRVSDSENYLGISDEPNPKIEYWQYEINRYKKRKS